MIGDGERKKAARELKGRILDILPAATYQMDSFFSLVDLEVTDRVSSASVSTGVQPRMLVNPEFVARNCTRDEHLLMLVLHELYHVILGHTMLFPRGGEAENIAFDALINARLAALFPDSTYLSFFEGLYSWDSFPGRLLRPPPGWGRSGWDTSCLKALPKKEAAVIRRLYEKGGRMATYQDVLDLLSGGFGKGKTPLLGDHDGPDKTGKADGAAARDPLFTELLRKAASKWPAKAQTAIGKDEEAGSSAQADFFIIRKSSPRADFLRALESLLRKAGILEARSAGSRSWQADSVGYQIQTVIPQLRDRRAFVGEALLGHPPLLRTEVRNRRQRRLLPAPKSHIYLDVSGSMMRELPWLANALDPLHRRGLCRIYGFSTEVSEIRKGTLLKDGVRTTYGTRIQCVYGHLLSSPVAQTPKKIVILTDGYTGIPDPKSAAETKARNIRVIVGLVGNNTGKQLKPFADVLESLPVMR